jgi:hypothetical protein
MRRYELAVNAIAFLPMIIGCGLALLMLWPLNLLAMLTLYTCGLLDLAYAKMPLLRHGVYASFGPSLIPRRRRVAYRRGYKRIVLGIGLNILLLVYYLGKGSVT